jgi:hypothetical protein
MIDMQPEVQQALSVIDKFASQKGVEPREMLGCLLAMLQNSHSSIVMQIQGRSRTLLDEVAVHAQSNGRVESPASIMAAVEVLLESYESCDRARAAEAKGQSASHLAAIKRQLLAEQSLRLILRELMNTAEHDMLRAAMWIDGMIGPDGRIAVDRPNDNPDEKNPPKKSPEK